MKRLIIIGLLVLGVNSFSNERDDRRQLDNLYRDKKYREAIDATKSYLEKYPTSRNYQQYKIRLGKTHYVRGDYKNAILVFQDVLNDSKLSQKEKDEYNYYISKSYLQIEDERKFREYMEKIDRSSNYYERAHYDSGIIYLDRDEYEKAFEVFKNLSSTGRIFKNTAVFNMALTAYNDEKYQLVIDILNTYVPLKDKNRDDVAILYLYGTSYYKLDRTQEAIRYFEELSKNHFNTPYGKKARVTLIEIYANLRNHDKVKELEKLVTGTSEESMGYIILGDYYVAMRNYNKGMEYYKKAGIDSNPRALYGYAYSLYQQDKFKEAAPYFKRLETTSYYNQAVYYKLAIYYKQNEFKNILDSRDEAKKVVVTQQDNDNINIIIANAAYELGDMKLAREYFAKLNLHTPSKDNLFRVITLSGALNRVDDVEKRVKTFNTLYPNDKEFKKKIYIAAGESLYNNNKSQVAENLYKEYLAKDEDKDVLEALINLLINEKKYSELDRYLGKKVPGADTEYLKGVSSTGIGKYEQGEKHYQEALKGIENKIENPLYNKIHFNRINNFFLWGKYNDVISKGNEYIKNRNSKERDNIVEKIALSYYRTGNYEKSREYLEMLKNTENSDRINLQIADTYFVQKKYSQAKETYLKIYNESKDDKNKELALYSITKVVAENGSQEELKKYSIEFLGKYPKSPYRENLLTNYSQAATNLKNPEDVIKTYKLIYSNTKEEYIKQEAIEKIVQGSIDIKKYQESEKYAKEIKNEVKKAYYLSQIYEKTGKKDSAAKEYEKLLKSNDYKEGALINLGNYWRNKGELKKAREYYVNIVNLKDSSYKDMAYYEIAKIDEKAGDVEKATTNYTVIYKNFPKSKYVEESKIKVAQLKESTDENTSLALYMDIAKNTKNKNYKSFSLEKIIYSSLRANQLEIAKKYYDELKKVDEEVAKKYQEFFQGEDKNEK